MEEKDIIEEEPATDDGGLFCIDNIYAAIDRCNFQKAIGPDEFDGSIL